MKRILLIITLALTTSFLNAQIVQNGLVANFPLAGNADDISPTNIDGTPINVSPATGYTGLAGTASFFDPAQTSYIEAGANNRAITNTVTLSAWIKTTLSSNQMIVDKYSFPGDQGYYIAVTQGKAILAGRDGSGNFMSGMGTTTISDGQWHHIVGIINVNTWQLWVDCELESSITTSTVNPDLTSSNPLSIGRYYYGTSQNNPMYFSGSIDEVRLYNRALTTAELDSLCDINANVGLQDMTEGNFTIYPNPISDRFMIGYSGSTDLSDCVILISNSLGQVVYEGAYTPTINISSFNKGVYYLSITDKDKTLLKRNLLIKQ